MNASPLTRNFGHLLSARLFAMLFTAALFAGTATSSFAQSDAPDRQPPSPEAIAQRAIDRINDLADRCETRLDELESKTLDRIADLKNSAGDNQEKAIAAAARRGAGAISKTAAACVRSVRNSAVRAAAAIERLGGDPALSASVKDAAEAAIRDIRAARQSAVDAIKDAAGIALDVPAE